MLAGAGVAVGAVFHARVPGPGAVVTVARDGLRPHTHPARSARRERWGRRCGWPSSHSTSVCSASTTTTRSCSGGWSRADRLAAAVGTAIHLQNGALFGAAYADLAPAARPAVRARAHWPAWSSTSPVAARARAGRPARCSASGSRGFAQSAWRHALFGVVLGELERRLNPPGRRARAGRRGRGRLQRPRLSGAPGRDELSRGPETRRHHGRDGFRRPPPGWPCARRPATRWSRCRARRASTSSTRSPRSAIAAARPEVVYHLAALAHVGRVRGAIPRARCATTSR